MTTADTILPYIAIAVSCVLIALSALSIGLVRLVRYWHNEANRYKKQLRYEAIDLAYEAAEKGRHDGPKVLAEDPAPNKALQARIEKSPDSAHNLASYCNPIGEWMSEKEVKSQNRILIKSAIAWTRQDEYRKRMESKGFVRVVDERGRTRYMKVENTAWVKSTKQWVRVSRSSKLFKDASFFFPGDYEKPTKNNYWQLLNRVHQDIEKAEGSGK